MKTQLVIRKGAAKDQASNGSVYEKELSKAKKKQEEAKLLCEHTEK